MLAADRYSYAPAMVLGVPVLAWGAQKALFTSSHEVRRSRTWCGMLVLLALSLESHMLCSSWSSSEALWRRVVHTHPYHDHPKQVETRSGAQRLGVESAYYNLGLTLLETQDMAGARGALESALAINPHHVRSWSTIGALHLKNSSAQSAVEAYQMAVKLKPNDPNNNYNLGVAHMEAMELEQAAQALERSLELRDDNAKAWFNLGNILLSTGDLHGAITKYERCLTVDPRHSKAWRKLQMARSWAQEQRAGHSKF